MNSKATGREQLKGIQKEIIRRRFFKCRRLRKREREKEKDTQKAFNNEVK
jgi:hypothetical protein